MPGSSQVNREIDMEEGLFAPVEEADHEEIENINHSRETQAYEDIDVEEENAVASDLGMEHIETMAEGYEGSSEDEEMDGDDGDYVDYFDEDDGVYYRVRKESREANFEDAIIQDDEDFIPIHELQNIEKGQGHHDGRSSHAPRLSGRTPTTYNSGHQVPPKMTFSRPKGGAGPLLTATKVRPNKGDGFM